MATPYTTFTGSVGGGEESTWSTEVARTVWWKVLAWTVEAAAERIAAANFTGDGIFAAHQEQVQVRETTRGRLRVFFDYDHLGMLIKHALGSLSTSGAGPYVHTYTHAKSLPTGLTFEGRRGTGDAEEVYGAKVNKLTIEVGANGIGTFEVELLAKNCGTRASGGSPSFHTGVRVVGHHTPGIVFNAVTHAVKRWKLTIDNKLSPVEEMGTIYTAEPERGSQPEFTLEAELFTRADTLYTAHKAGTQGDAVTTFTHPTAGHTIVVTLENAVIHECTTPMEGGGIMSTRILMRGYSDGTKSGCKIVVTNSTSSGVA